MQSSACRPAAAPACGGFRSAYAGRRGAVLLALAGLALAAGSAPAAGQPATQPAAPPGPAQPAPLSAAPGQPAVDGMVVARIEVVGLQSINEGFVRRTIKLREGAQYQVRQLQEDVRELLRTRKFLNVFAGTRVEAGQAVVTITVQEKPVIRSVEIEGNKRFDDLALFKELAFAAGDILDRYSINKGREDLLRKYREAGYYYAEVALDEPALDDGRVLYSVVEGPRVRIREIVFEGARSFSERRLKSKVQTKKWFPIFRTGAFNEEQADRDALDLQQFYRDEGFLDARVGYRMDFDPVNRADLKLAFVIEEGLRYRIAEVALSGNAVFDEPRILSVLRLLPGSLAREEVRREDQRRIQDLYGEIGYVDARIDPTYEFTAEPGLVRLRWSIEERSRSKFGRITIRGNSLTRDEVIRRELRFYPDEDYNTVKARRAERRLQETGLFSKAAITPLEDVQGWREAVVEVEEGQQVDFLIGFGVSTDSGVIGSITVNNRNFDLFGWPRTWGQFFRGQAFRGAGQTLRVTLEPGTELSRFRIDFSEPYFLEKQLRLDASIYLWQRDRDAYTEQRAGTGWSLSKRFEGGPLDNWAIEGGFDVQGVDIDDVRAFAAREIREVRGSSALTSVKAGLVRDTTDSRLLPSEGYRISFTWEQAGALGGDYSFGRPSIGGRYHLTTFTDVLDRKSILSLRADTGYIVGDAPVFERYYAGGFGTLRGFDYRGVSPRKGVYNDAVGGDFILLVGAEQSVPLYADFLRGVVFLDMGTVEEDFEVTSWRASVGFGLRLNVNFLGGVPMIFDFGFPIAKDDEDEERLFNFSFGASF